MRKHLDKKIAAVALGAVALTGTGVAYAYWTTTGSGEGSAATTAGAPDVTVTQTAGPTHLAPGVAAEGVTVTVTNNADNDAYVSQVVASIKTVTKAFGAPAGDCDASDYVLTGATMTNGSGDLVKGGVATFTGAELAFDNKPGVSQDGCKGATVTLAYAAS